MIAVRQQCERSTGGGPQACAAARGITLIEMLVVVAIIAVIAAVSIGALVLIPERGRIRGTQALIEKIDNRLAARLNEFSQRRLSVSAITVDGELAASDPSRSHVIAVIRTMRQDFPEFFSIDSARTSDMTDNDGDGSTDEPDEVIAGQWNPITVTTTQTFQQLPAAAVSWLRYMQRAFADNASFSSLHQAYTARSECLYMIVTRGGADADEFVAGETADTDEDGLLEFVDKWGNPIQFFLWPTHYLSPVQNPGSDLNPDDPHQLLTENQDPMTSWWSTSSKGTFESLFHSLTNLAGTAPQAYRTRPLIISAGPDGGFGLITSGAGADAVMGTQDDIGSVFSRAQRITATTTDGYGMDADNIDNHSSRAQ